MILATGANGMLGGYFPSDRVMKTDLPEMDVTDLEKVRAVIHEHRPQHVLHLAAWTDVDGAETHVDDVFRTNAIGTLHVATAANEVGAALTYISTTQVFDGTQNEPYTEFDEPRAVNTYGRGKLEGERIIRALCPQHYIFRAGWMMGGGLKDHKFVGKIYDLAKARDSLSVVSDKRGSPTYARDMASGILQHIETGIYGTFHMVNGGGTCTRYEMAQEIARTLDRDIPIEAISSDLFPLPARRGDNESALNYKLELMGRNSMPSWKEALHTYIREELIDCGR